MTGAGTEGGEAAREGRRRPERLGAWAWGLASLLALGVCTAQVLGPVWLRDPRVAAPASRQGPPDLGLRDLQVHVARTANIARALVRHPLEVHRDPPCHPFENSLALGEPMLTPGLLGTPASLVSDDPLLVYNAAILLVVVAGAASAFLLVLDWTGVPAAALVAGLLYGFHARKLGDPVHLFAADMAWILLALLFARRLAERGRWRDGVGLGACGALQMGTSFYPLVASLLLVVPAGVWLLPRFARRPRRAAPLLAALPIAAAAALFIFTPYFELRSSGELLRRDEFIFAPWSFLWPWRYVGWLCTALAAAALLLPRGRALVRGAGDPRWALLAGALLAALLATGGGGAGSEATPPLFSWASRLVPGLDAVRAPGAIAVGLHAALAILAGLGAAAVIRSVPSRLATAIGVLLALAAWAATLGPAPLGGGARLPFRAVDLRPSEETLAFFRSLRDQGNDGPLFELPMPELAELGSVRVLLTAYHHRRTSACAISYVPPERTMLRELALRLPQRKALEELSALGFTTAIVHRPGPDVGAVARRRLEDAFAAAARKEGSGLRWLYTAPMMTAYAIEP